MLNVNANNKIVIIFFEFFILFNLLIFNDLDFKHLNVMHVVKFTC
jgi:hypothetical protein